MGNSEKALEMGLGCLKCRMEISIKAASRMEQKMVKANSTKWMAQYAKGTSSMATYRVTEPSDGPMGPPTRVKLTMEYQKAQEGRFGQMGTNILDLSKKGKETAKGRWFMTILWRAM